MAELYGLTETVLLVLNIESFLKKGWLVALRSDNLKRRLAYSIRRQRDGHYVFVYAAMPPALCAELERQFRFTEEVMRFMITLGEPPKAPDPVVEPAVPAVVAAPAAIAAPMMIEEPEVVDAEVTDPVE